MSSFADFYQAVWGYPPFGWQQDLADRLAAVDFPQVVAVPTGLGKTSIIDAWAWAAAHNSKVPTRLIYVVDRRLIVDQAWTHAQHLRQQLETSEHPTVRYVAEQLRERGGGDPLWVARMRGGITWESRWVRSPAQPAVVTATVDQVGSRLLFRGYGLRPTMRPVDAGLVGIDSWIVVDEAHLSEPFLRTLRQIQDLQTPERQVGLPTMRFTFMSATPPADADQTSVLSPTLDELMSDPGPDVREVLQTRLTVSKPVHLVEAGFIKGKKVRARAVKIGEALADLAVRLTEETEHRPVVGVVANTVAAARAAFNRLRDHGYRYPDDLTLLTGRIREAERKRIITQELQTAVAERPRDTHPDHPTFIVATQTIEVGADLDFDFLITEAAPLSSLVQRFGRVNRRGEGPVLKSVVVYVPKHHQQDPVYGEAVANTWNYLTSEHPPTVMKKTRDVARWRPANPSLDLSVSNTIHLLKDAPAGVAVKAPFTPVLVSAHIERLAHTYPTPFPDQPVAPFLRGAQRDPPTVSVAWRCLTKDPDHLEGCVELLRLAPVRAWEFVDVPIGEFLRLINPDIDVAAGDVDVDTRPVDHSGAINQTVLGLVLTTGGDPEPIRRGDRIQPGDRVVLDVSVGGYDRWGWTGNPGDAPVPDVGNDAPTARAFRLDPYLLETQVETQGIDAELVREVSDCLKAQESGSQSALSGLLEDAGVDPTALPGVEKRMKNWLIQVIEVAGRKIGVARQPGRTAGVGFDLEDDTEDGSSLAGTPRLLEDHNREVGTTAHWTAKKLGLNSTLVKTLCLAGRYHDLGKADPRFQLMLYDADPLAAASGPLRAKSGRDPSDPAARQARALARVPSGFRHEALSARIVEQHVQTDQDVDRELLVHLVAAHHGRARPLHEPLIDPDAQPLQLDIDQTRVEVPPMRNQTSLAEADRFERLCRRYGWWGLAYLEAIVRMADMTCSEEGK